MSVTPTTSESDWHSVVHLDIPTCGHCDNWRNPDASVEGSFCSEYCYYASKGQKSLNRIKSDHTRCATCFRRVKTIERPPEGDSVIVEPPAYDGAIDDVRDVLVGYQYQTEHTVWGVDDFGSDAVPALKRQRWSCECGNVDPRKRDGILERVALGETIHRCFDCLVDCYKTGAIENAPDADRFQTALQREGVDWPYAIGRALYE